MKKLSDIKFYSYDFKKIDETEKDNPVHIEFGTMVEEAPPEIQSSNGKGIDLYSYIGLTTKAVQELSQKVETLEQKIAELEAEYFSCGTEPLPPPFAALQWQSGFH